MVVGLLGLVVKRDNLQLCYNLGVGKKNIVILLLVMLLAGNTIYSQSVFRFLGRGRKLRVERKIVTNVRNQAIARKVLKSQSLTINRREVVRSPMRVVGPNIYLKGIGKGFKGLSEWDKVGDSRGYNGAHHIVTKFVIKEIGGGSEAIRQGPSVFHPYHNNPRYGDWFHNHQRQLEIYKEKGIKGILDSFFESVGDGWYSVEDKEQIYLEAELWAKHWNLKWE